MADTSKPDNPVDSQPPEKDSTSKPKEIPLGWLGTNNPMPSPYRSAPPAPPQIITRIVEKPSLSHAMGMATYQWLKSRVLSSWDNLKSDVAFCRKGFQSAFAEGWWYVITNAWHGLNRAWEIFLGTTITAAALVLYAYYIYPAVGRRWTAILALSLSIFGLLVTIRVTRRLYEKNQNELQGAQTRLATLEEEILGNAEAKRQLTALQESIRPILKIEFKPKEEPYEQVLDSTTNRKVFRISVTSPQLVVVIVRVENVKLDAVSYPNVYLHPMDLGDIKRIDLYPDMPEYWDVVVNDPEKDHALLYHISPNYPKKLVPINQEFTVVASPKDGPRESTRAKIKIERCPDKDLQFTLTEE
jgi:hypothetical protein